MTTTILWLVLASHAAYVTALLVRARFSRTASFGDEATEGILHLVAAYTSLLWLPLVVAIRTTRRLVLDPLRLSIEWGADHGDSETKPEKYTHSGRVMRPVIPRVLSVGSYTRSTWVRDVDKRGTQTNRIVEIGFRYFGIAVIQLGLPVADRTEEAGA